MARRLNAMYCFPEHPRHVPCRILWLGLFAVLLVTVGASEFPIDNFEDPAGFSRWTFYNGAEFPGATGSLSRAGGWVGSGAVLAYDFTGGGAYVSANLTLPTPLSGSALAFWVKSPVNVRVRLRVTDTTGQTLQYGLVRPFWNLDPTAWYRHVVLLNGPSGWWGGANDGQLHPPIKSLSILAGDALEAGAVGAIAIDEVALLDSSRSTSTLRSNRSSPRRPAAATSGNASA